MNDIVGLFKEEQKELIRCAQQWEEDKRKVSSFYCDVYDIFVNCLASMNKDLYRRSNIELFMMGFGEVIYRNNGNSWSITHVCKISLKQNKVIVRWTDLKAFKHEDEILMLSSVVPLFAKILAHTLPNHEK